LRGLAWGYAVGRDVVYRDLPSEGDTLPEPCARDMLPLVELQLAKAGVRLATVLNGALISARN
jgi:hypothetical protein